MRASLAAAALSLGLLAIPGPALGAGGPAPAVEDGAKDDSAVRDAEPIEAGGAGGGGRSSAGGDAGSNSAGAAAGSASAAGAPRIDGWTPPTWSSPRPRSDPGPLHAVGAVTRLPATGWAAEGALVAGLERPFAVVRLQATVSMAPGRALGVRLPLVLDPGLQAGLASGNLVVDYHLHMGRTSNGADYLGTVSFVLPSASNPQLFLLVPGHDRMSAGMEAAFGLQWRSGRWRGHAELNGGIYGDGLMPLRGGLTAAVAWQAKGPLHLFAQADPWLVFVPEQATGDVRFPGGDPTAAAQLGVTAGVELHWSGGRVRAAWQRVLNHADDHHLWLGVSGELSR